MAGLAIRPGIRIIADAADAEVNIFSLAQDVSIEKTIGGLPKFVVLRHFDRGFGVGQYVEYSGRRDIGTSKVVCQSNLVQSCGSNGDIFRKSSRRPLPLGAPRWSAGLGVVAFANGRVQIDVAGQIIGIDRYGNRRTVHTSVDVVHLQLDIVNARCRKRMVGIGRQGRIGCSTGWVAKIPLLRGDFRYQVGRKRQSRSSTTVLRKRKGGRRRKQHGHRAW